MKLRSAKGTEGMTNGLLYLKAKQRFQSTSNNNSSSQWGPHSYYAKHMVQGIDVIFIISLFFLR
jgi:hypothetical protein